MNNTITVNVNTNWYLAGHSDVKVQKLAFQRYVKSLPYRVITINSVTFGVGGEYAFVDCYTNKGLALGVKKLVYGANTLQVHQLAQWTRCSACGHEKAALCHRLPNSLGGTPCVNNIDVGCADCNHKQSNQIVKKVITQWMLSEPVNFSYELPVL